MESIWINTDKGDDKIIAITKDQIVKANPKESKLYEYENAIKENNIPKDAFCIPFSYINAVRLQENKNYIQIYFGHGLEEYIRVKNNDRKQAIFETLKDAFPKVIMQTEDYSATTDAKKPLYAIGVIVILFLIAGTFAHFMALGAQFEVVGNQRSMATVILALAGFGLPKLILISGILLAIAIISYIHKSKIHTKIHTIYISR